MEKYVSPASLIGQWFLALDADGPVLAGRIVRGAQRGNFVISVSHFRTGISPPTTVSLEDILTNHYMIFTHEKVWAQAYDETRIQVAKQ